MYDIVIYRGDNGIHCVRVHAHVCVCVHVCVHACVHVCTIWHSIMTGQSHECLYSAVVTVRCTQLVDNDHSCTRHNQSLHMKRGLSPTVCMCS